MAILPAQQLFQELNEINNLQYSQQPELHQPNEPIQEYLPDMQQEDHQDPEELQQDIIEVDNQDQPQDEVDENEDPLDLLEVSSVVSSENNINSS